MDDQSIRVSIPSVFDRIDAVAAVEKISVGAILAVQCVVALSTLEVVIDAGAGQLLVRVVSDVGLLDRNLDHVVDSPHSAVGECHLTNLGRAEVDQVRQIQRLSSGSDRDPEVGVGPVGPHFPHQNILWHQCLEAVEGGICVTL